MSLRRILLLTLAVTSLAWWHFAGAGRHPAPGVVAPEDPQQDLVGREPATWPIGEYQATALADYRLHARVLGIEHYRYDAGARIAPVDLALGWGAMSDWSVYSRLDISQRGRFYVYQWRRKEGPPIPAPEIICHSANNHIIPADDEVARVLAGVHVNDVIWLEGQLVEVRGPGGFVWRSSLSRTDTGSGACELFRVTRMVVEPAPQG